MSYDYKPDRWRDKSIISQTAAKIAADLTMKLLDLYPPADGSLGEQAVQALFAPLHAEVVSTILSGAGEDDSSIFVSQGNYSDPPRSGTNSSTGGAPYGSTKMNFGKFKGMTLEEINNAVDDQGGSGRGWIEWLNRTTKDDFQRKATGAFLEATRNN